VYVCIRFICAPPKILASRGANDHVLDEAASGAGDSWSTCGADSVVTSNRCYLCRAVERRTYAFRAFESSALPTERGAFLDGLAGTLAISASNGTNVNECTRDEAMTGSWDTATALIQMPPLAATLGDRHHIITNDWQMAYNSTLIAKLLRRATQLQAATDLAPPANRADLGSARTTPSLVLSAAELLDHAADLFAQSAVLVHDSEPRWRRFRLQVQRFTNILGRYRVA
jgi:hypothetical protein